MEKQDRAFFGALQRDLMMLAASGRWNQEIFEQMQFRMSWACPAEDCKEEHVCRGTFIECLGGLLVMAQLGFPSIHIEIESYAMELDAMLADEAAANAERDGTAPKPMSVAEMLKTLGGKPGA